MIHPEIGKIGEEYKLLKKPSSMSQMPFWGTYICNWLHNIIFNFKWLTNFQGLLSYLKQSVNNLLFIRIVYDFLICQIAFD